VTIDEIIARVREYDQQFGGDLFPGADEAELARLKVDVQERYGIALPEDYLALLRRVNGLSHDGRELFGSRDMFLHPGDQEYPSIDGIVEANEGKIADGVEIPGALAVGRGWMGDDYGIEVSTGVFVRYDLYGKPLKRFESFDEMFREMFEPAA
jgi:hypothetical protein